MSQHYQQFLANYHCHLAQQFSSDKVGKHVECRVADQIYVYLYEGNKHIQTQTVDIPERWETHWPSERTVKSFIRRNAMIGSAPITSLDA